MRKTGPSPKASTPVAEGAGGPEGCGENRPILRCRPRRWTRHSLRPPPRLGRFSLATPPARKLITGSSNASYQAAIEELFYQGAAARATLYKSPAAPSALSSISLSPIFVGMASNGMGFTVGATPVISSLSLIAGRPGAWMTVTGANFGATQGTSTVTFNGTPATPLRWDDTQIAVTVPAAATTGNIMVTVGGVASNGSPFTVGTMPVIFSLSQVTGIVGTSLTITGVNFGVAQGTSTVTFNGTSAAVTSWGDTQIVAAVPSGATTGNIVVTVEGVASNGVSFAVNTTPAISPLSQLTGPVGASLTITGVNFGATQGTSTVAFNGTPATPTSWSGTQILVPVPAGATTGNIVVTVGGVASNGVPFTVGTIPVIASLSQAAGPVGAPLTIAGANFGAKQVASTVTFNGTRATPLSWSDTQIELTVPAGATTGNIVVTVDGVASNGVSFTVGTMPVIFSLSEVTGAVDTSLTITGVNFGAKTSTVTFNGTPGTPSKWDDTQIVVTVPSGATTGNVVVTVGGVASNGVSFAVDTTPAIIALSQVAAPVGALLTITGVHFGATQSTSTVAFNGTLATPTSWSDTQITVTVPAGATSGNITVTVGSLIAIDPTKLSLLLLGPMSSDQETRLLSLSADPNYQAAIQYLFQQSTSAWSVAYTAALNALPSISFPALNSGSIVFKSPSGPLTFTGALSDTDEATLLNLSPGPSYRSAIEGLYQEPRQFIVTRLYFLDTTSLIAELINDPTASVSDKYGFLLNAMLNSIGLVVQSVSTLLGLDVDLVRLVLVGGQSSSSKPLLNSTINPNLAAIADFFALLGNGLSAYYYSKPNFGGVAQPQTVEPAIDFTWSPTAPPLPGLDPSEFSAKWAGRLVGEFSEAYTFYVQVSPPPPSGAGVPVTLIVNGQAVALSLSPSTGSSSAPVGSNSSTVEFLGTANLIAGGPTQIELYYPNATGLTITSLQLSWSSLSTTKSTIPQHQLYSSSTFTFDQPLATLQLLYRIALSVNTFRITLNDLNYLAANPASFAGVDPVDPTITAAFNLNLLPAASASYSPALFNQWERLLALFTLRDSLPTGDSGLLGLFEAAGSSPAPSGSTLFSAVAAATTWNVSELGILLGSQIDPLIGTTIGFGLTAGDFIDERWLVRLQSCFGLTTRFGVSSKHLFEWASLGSNSLTEPNIATDIQAAIKAQYDDATWVNVGSSLNDQLRESSRDALVAYILANQGTWQLGANLTTPDDLYEYYLIDVEMSACMQTSRVVQATAAIQLFVQRCLMNLEQGISPAAVDTTVWSWMENYRVWQANREVFLFPEDYMDPTLRDDKTPFFQDLESRLQQNPLTEDTAEQAVINYLEQLDQVARLDIRAMYWNYSPNPQTLPDGTVDSSNDILHVFARTPATPNNYFYRQLFHASQYGQQDSPSVWTPWQSVDVGIQGDQLIPVVWDGRLYIFWPLFTETSDPTTPPPTKSAPPTKTLQIQMAWSRYSQGGWTAKHVSTDSLTPQFVDILAGAPSADYWGALTSSVFLFSTDKTQSDELVIRVWIPQWGSTSYVPGANIPGEGGSTPQAQTGAVFEGAFVFTGCANDGIVVYTDPVYNWNQNLTVSLGEYFPLKCQYDSNEVNVISGAKELSLFTYGITTPATIDFLTQTPSPYRIAQTDAVQPLTSASDLEFFLPNQPFIYQDATRTYFVNPGGIFYTFIWTTYWVSMQFVTFWHPHACAFIRIANQYGIRSLMSILTQQMTNDGTVVSGFALSTTNILTPGLTPGILYTQGQLYQTTLPPTVPAMPASSTQQLFCNPQGQLYYSPQTAWTPGDALIGSLVSSATAITQVSQPPQPAIFSGIYGPSQGEWLGYGLPYVSPTYPLEDVDFSFAGAYSIYNWELFFHIPLLIATQLSADQQFQAAQEWFHYIFDPTTNSTAPSPQRFWNFLPFYECSTTDEIVGPLEVLLRQLDGASGVITFQGALYASSNQVNWVSGPQFDASWVGATITIPETTFTFGTSFTVVSVESPSSLTASEQWLAGLNFSYSVKFTSPRTECGQDVQSQISAWQSDPFDPFLIGRLRTIAFRKMVVMNYLDNLIAWGDSLFSQNTRESINEATQLYVLAQQILGDKPISIPPQGSGQDYSYNDLVTLGLDDFSNVLVTLESTFPFSNGASGTGGTESLNGTAAQSFYFCVPPDSQLLGYWDTVADRLYKIRHCMNIQGQVEQLPLFAPPINPAILVQAEAAGVDLSSVLNDINSPVPNYRFSTFLQKALELCAEVRSLGTALLSALEKNDAEGLSVLRATQEISLLQAVLQIKQSQIDEANDNLAGLQASQAVTQYKQQYYQSLITAGLSSYEQLHVAQLAVAQGYQEQSQFLELQSGLAGLLPNFTIGTEGISSPVATFTFGGIDLQGVYAAQSREMNMLASYCTYLANMASIMGSWDRRSQDWNFQSQTATKELVQIQNQIDAATVRVQIAQTDLQNQQLQISNAQAVLDFLNSKYTNQELYSWMISQISSTYFQCYQMAYGLAKRAEACFRFELGLTTSNYIQFGYWDGLHKGLLAGEGLYADLKRMELAYLDQNRREYEITKYISLVLLDPLALITLKETGQCVISLPEALFDLDYPGHYLRRIKCLSLTIPCVTGPYTSVNATLTLSSNQIRVDSSASSPQDYIQGSHFISNLAATQAIATSSAQNDSGMFELNFRDERYLPFEGAGVISTWLLQLPQDCNAFDFETISDVVLNLKYTARDGGAALQAIARQAASLPGPADQGAISANSVPFPSQNNLVRFFSLRHEFPTEWYKLLNPPSSDIVQTMMLALTKERFPYQYRGKKVSVTQIDLLLKFKDIYDTQRFKTGTPLGDFAAGQGTPGSLNVYAVPASFMPGQQPQPPTQPPQGVQPITLTSVAASFDGTPYGTGAVALTTGFWWLQIFTSGNYMGSVASTLLDSNNHLIPTVIDDIFLVCHYSAS